MVESAEGSTGRIFISYRREETAYPAGWLFDRLEEVCGAGQIFKNVDSIELGDDFVEMITRDGHVCLLLCQLRSEGHGAGFEVCVGEEGSVDHVGEAAFEDAKRLGFVLAAFAAALKELTCGLVVVGLGDRDPVDRGVELSVAGSAEPVTRPVA